MILEARSTKAGASTPATRADVTVFSSTLVLKSLNEGRGFHPGDTRPGRQFPAPPFLRSTKAGASTPATPRRPARARRPRCPLNEGRGFPPRRHPDERSAEPAIIDRSTKAGASTPATRAPP